LLRALGSLPRPETRAAIADVAHKCGAAAVPPLIDAMENDKSRMVRPRAASALGRIGDGRARPALAKAARSEDANLVWAANNALKKLH
jgi:HEAT repeat protein